MAKIVLATFGSLGDLHPYIAVALGLKAQRHSPVIATSELYRSKVEAEGIGFHAVRPDLAELGEETDVIRRLMHRRKGPEYLTKHLVLPHLRAAYQDLSTALPGVDLVVSHPLTYAAPLAAETQRVPWIGSVLQPLGFFSAYDPPVLPLVSFLARLRPLPPAFHAGLFRFLKWTVRDWMRPVYALRAELGLPPAKGNPMFEGQFSPRLNLALFSRVIAAPQPDWPANIRVTGFPFYDRGDSGPGLAPELARFLDSGSPPIVFTLGSSAVMDAGGFYAESIKAAARAGKRAVLLIGRDPRNWPQQPLPEGMAAFEYASYSELFPRAALIVHSGGIGTTGQALAAGRPMLVIPYAFDQPDNAARVVRLGVARTLSRRRYNARRAALELQRLMDDRGYAERAVAIAAVIRQEDGVSCACEAIEEALNRRL
jgi:rhamnosyltransferase subunit B